MTVPAAENLRRQTASDPWSDVAIEAAADPLDAIDALHQPDSDGDICDQCLFEWPCPTARLLHPTRKEDK